MSRILSRSVDPDTVGRLATESVGRLLDAYSAAVYRQDASTGDLVLFATAGPAPGGLAWFPRVSESNKGMALLAVQEGRPVVSPDATNDPRIGFSAERREAVRNE